MKLKAIYFFILLTVTFKSYALPDGNSEHYKADSLKSILLHATLDTEQIRLRCLIGLEEENARMPYWDSLLSDIRGHNLYICECRALLGVSRFYKAQGNTAQAISCLNRGILIAGSRGCKAELIPLIKNLASLYQNSPSGKKMLDLCYKGLKIAEELGDKKAAVDFYSDISRCYFFMGDKKKSLEMHLICLRICRELHYNFGIASALVDVGSDYISLGDIKRACDYYLESGKYANAVHPTIYDAYIYNSVGSAYVLKNEMDSAYKYIYKSYEIHKRLNNTRGMAGTQIALAKAMLANGDSKGAEREALASLRLSDSTGFIAQLPDVTKFLRALYLRQNNYKKAYWAYELYIAARDSLSSENTRKQALQKEFEYNFEKKEHENKVLAQRYQIQSLEVNKSHYLVFGLIALVSIIIIMGYLFLKQSRIKSEQQSLQLEQKLLRSQMNPHFIFNSLNSIQQFIISKKNDQAESYLSKFARLIRDLLESNSKDSISVKEEADMLMGYIEMESLRFTQSFSYSVMIDETIDQETSIPHMMIQPFVENAIWHGLLPKEKDRQLQISFSAALAGTIRCVVDDNGIGRSESIKKNSTFKKSSLALSFISQRLQLMRKTLKVNCSMHITDKVDSIGKSAGTRVVIILPIIKK